MTVTTQLRGIENKVIFLNKQIDSDLENLINQYTECLSQLKQLGLAELDRDDSLIATHTAVNIQHSLASLYYDQANFTRATSYLKQSLKDLNTLLTYVSGSKAEELSQMKYQLLADLGDSYFQHQSYSEATAVYATLIELKPDPAQLIKSMELMGRSLYLNNKFVQAEGVFTKLVKQLETLSSEDHELYDEEDNRINLQERLVTARELLNDTQQQCPLTQCGTAISRTSSTLRSFEHLRPYMQTSNEPNERQQRLFHFLQDFEPSLTNKMFTTTTAAVRIQFSNGLSMQKFADKLKGADIKAKLTLDPHRNICTVLNSTITALPRTDRNGHISIKP